MSVARRLDPEPPPPSEPAPAAVELQSATKVYGVGSAHPVTALEDVSLAIGDNAFFTLLGPSGCGKTTLLRATSILFVTSSFLIGRPRR